MKAGPFFHSVLSLHRRRPCSQLRQMAQYVTFDAFFVILARSSSLATPRHTHESLRTGQRRPAPLRSRSDHSLHVNPPTEVLFPVPHLHNRRCLGERIRPTPHSILERHVRQRHSLTSSLQLLGNHPTIAVYALWAIFWGEDGRIRAGSHLDTGKCPTVGSGRPPVC